VSRHVLNFAAELTLANTFFLLTDGRTIRASIKEAESVRHTVEFPVRFRKPYAGGLHIRPLDSELATWFVESAVIHRDLARLELQLANVPAHVSWAFLEI
jgi:hypothetical protein